MTYSYGRPLGPHPALLDILEQRIEKALGGTEPHDVSKLIAGIGKLTSALNVHEQQLGELIGNFNTFLGAFAAQSGPLKATIAELPSAIGGSFASSSITALSMP